MSAQLGADVEIVGARAGGASTAMLLARAGLDVIVIDRSRYGLDTLSTHALMRAAVLQLRRWDLIDKVAAAGTPAVPRVTFHYAAKSNTIEFEAGDELYAPRRTVLDPLLVDSAREAGARVLYGLTAIGVQRDHTDRVTGVVAQDAGGHVVSIRARLVIGADGINSATARFVGAPIERAADGAMAFMYRYWSDVEINGYEFAFNTAAAGGAIPTNDGLTNVFVGTFPDRLTTEPELYTDLLRATHPEMAERVLAGTPVGKTRRFSGRAGYMRRPVGPGWALVGDAGYWKDPIAAHGISDALRDAELLSRAVVSGFDTGSLDDSLTQYHDERNRLSGDLFAITDRIARGEWTDNDIAHILRDLSRSTDAELTALTELGPWPGDARAATSSSTIH